MKHIHKSKTNKVLAGVCGGIGDYFQIDPVMVRLLWVFISVLTGVVPGILVYIVAIFVIPESSS